MTISNKASRIFLDTEKGMDIYPEINDREILILIDLIRNLLRAFLAVVVVVDVGIVVSNRKHFMVDNDGHEVKKKTTTWALTKSFFFVERKGKGIIIQY